MLKIEQIVAKNFKCHKNLKLDFSSFNILAGSNAAGKSSLIQAILLGYKSWKEYEKKKINTNNIMEINLGIPTNIISEQADQREVEICFQTDKKQNSVKLGLAEDDEMYFNILNYNEILKQSLEDNSLDKVNLFFLNAERTGPRIVSAIKEPLSYSVGYHGENTAYLICKMDREQKLKNNKLPVDLKISELERFSANCEEWLNVIIPETEIQYSVDIEKNIAALKYKNEGEFYE